MELNKFGKIKEKCRRLQEFGMLRKYIDHCNLSLAQNVSMQTLAKRSMDVVLLLGRKFFMQKDLPSIESCKLTACFNRNAY